MLAVEGTFSRYSLRPYAVKPAKRLNPFGAMPSEDIVEG